MKIQGAMSVAMASLLATLAACQRSDGDRSPASGDGSHVGGGRHAAELTERLLLCPAAVPGTTATSSDVEGGAALTFITTGAVADLRARVRRLAGTYGGHGSGEMLVPAATASFEEIESGGRLVLRAEDVAQVEALRERVRVHVEHVNRGECPWPPPGVQRETTAPGDAEDRAHHPPKAWERGS